MRHIPQWRLDLGSFGFEVSLRTPSASMPLSPPVHLLSGKLSACPTCLQEGHRLALLLWKGTPQFEKASGSRGGCPESDRMSSNTSLA